MDGETAALKGTLDRLLKEAAEVSLALGRSNGTISGVPHYSVIKAHAHELGQHPPPMLLPTAMVPVPAFSSRTLTFQ